MGRGKMQEKQGQKKDKAKALIKMKAICNLKTGIKEDKKNGEKSNF